MQTLFQLINFMSVVAELMFHFLIYKYFKRNNIQCNEEDINGKCVVVTGGSNGIGRSSAREFARRGATVVIGDVDVENGQKVVQEIINETGNMNVKILRLDLSDMDSVELFATTVSGQHPKIKILVNNAGMGGTRKNNIKTKDGFNIHMAVNYMGHFLLTNLLMENLTAETNPRIVSTSSTFQLMSQLDIDDLNMDKSGFGLQNGLPYFNSKFCLALFTKELGRCNGINAYSLCPGMVDTALLYDAPKSLQLFYQLTISIFASTADQAASQFIMYCALEMSIAKETGKMYRFRDHFHRANKRLDSNLARNLWEKSATLVKLDERLARVKRMTK